MSRDLTWVGTRVRVKSIADIRATLDADGNCDGMPFMPEMLKYCGREFVVSKSAHKTCDTATRTGGRKVRDAVHLDELRCDGSGHGGCDAYCLLFWKTQWLEPAANAISGVVRQAETVATHDASEWLLARSSAPSSGNETQYRCQVTDVPHFSDPLAWWRPGQYVKDWRYGNYRGGEIVKYGVLKFLQNRVEGGRGHALFLRLYNALQALFRDPPGEYANSAGRIARGRKTPAENLGLKVNDVVRVKAFDEIRGTINVDGKNRGMRFDIEMKPYCDRRFRVAKVVRKIVDETSGRLVEIKSPSVILHGAYCRAVYSTSRMFCPRGLPPIWRDVWLTRSDEDATIPVIDITDVAEAETNSTRPAGVA